MNDAIATKTQQALSSYVKKAPLTPKLLSKPPFRFLHDVISEVIKTTGYAADLFTKEEMDVASIKDKEGKIAYLNKIITHVGTTLGVEVKARPPKIVAGLDPEDTNAFLQLLGKAAKKPAPTAGKSSTSPAKKSPSKVEKPSVTEAGAGKRAPTSTKTKPLDPAEKEAAKSSAKPAPADQPDSANTEGDANPISPIDDSEEGVLVSPTQPTDAGRSDDPVGSPINQYDMLLSPINDIQNAPPVSSSGSAQVEDKTKSKEKDHETAKLVDTPKDIANSAEETQSTIEPSPQQIHQSASDAPPAVGKKAAPVVAQPAAVEAAPNKQLDIPQRTDSKSPAPSQDHPKRGKTAKTRPDPPIVAPMEDKSELDIPSTEEETHWLARPMSVRRPMRPASARPAPPRQKVAEAVAEVPQSTVNIIEDRSKQEDDDENYVVVAPSAPVSVPTPAVNGGDPSQEQHGGLVRKMLETQKEIEVENGAAAAAAAASAGDALREHPSSTNMFSAREKATARKEIEALRGSIQLLCRSTHPLGTTLDYVQEDVDSMNKELGYWVKEYRSYKARYDEMLRVTQQALTPLETHLMELNQQIEDKYDAIAMSKAKIGENEITIKKLLSNVTQPLR